MTHFYVVTNIHEAIKKALLWLPIYQAVLKKTGSQEQALEAIEYLLKLENQEVSQ